MGRVREENGGAHQSPGHEGKFCKLRAGRIKPYSLTAHFGFLHQEIRDLLEPVIKDGGEHLAIAVGVLVEHLTGETRNEGWLSRVRSVWVLFPFGKVGWVRARST